MASSGQLDLHLKELGDDLLSDQVFDILRKYLQPDCDTSLKTVVPQITALLPAGNSYSREAGSIFETCYDVAKQIPYSHPSMTKLVTLVDSCINSPRLSQVNGQKMALSNDVDGLYQMLGQTLRDNWDCSKPTEDGWNSPSKYLSFQTFAARIHERGMLNIDTWPFPSKKGNAYLKAASQWLILSGDAILLSRDVTVKEWKHWHSSISDVTEGKSSRQDWKFDEETVFLAGRAREAMEAVETNRKKDGPADFEERTATNNSKCGCIIV